LRTRRAGVAAATLARVASRRAYRTTAARRTVVVRVTVNSAAYRRVRRASVRKVVLTVAATRPSKATAKVTVGVPRPR
jgi:hypothetical protein